MACFNGACSSLSRRPQVVDGQWSPWSQYGVCSRTCGGGVQFSERRCDSPVPANGGTYCLGDKTRVKSCNWEECGNEETTDFRAQQCASHNGRVPRPLTVRGPTEWVPKYTDVTERSQCKLICDEKHGSAYVTWSQQVVDGTR